MASLPGATVLYRLKAGGRMQSLGWPCENILAMCLWLSLPSFSGTRTVGDRWEPQMHLSNIFQTLSLGCSWFGRICRGQNTGAQDWLWRKGWVL